MQKEKICLTFDVEEFSIPIDYNIQSKHTNNTEFSKKGLENILSLLTKHNIKATFFTTGYFAEKQQDIVKKLHMAGHEIASHSYKDENHSNFTKKQTFEKIKLSKEILESTIKSKIKGFRMPQFSINKHTLKILKTLNFKYDSSLHPAIVPGHYYNFFKPTKIYKMENLTEIPISVLPLIRFPISWLWMRNLGNWVTNLGTKFNNPTILYFHPWEFTKLPKIKGIPNYITRKTGKIFLDQLKRYIEFNKTSQFCKLSDLLN